MKKLIILVLVTAIFLFVFVAGGLAKPVIQINQKDDIGPISVWNPCTLETVLLEGTYHLNGQLLIDAAGGFHLNAHVNVHLTGVGLLSDEDYIGKGRANLTLKLKDGSADVLNGMMKIQLISKGQEANATLTMKVHITVNANGDVTAVIWDIGAIECL